MTSALTVTEQEVLHRLVALEAQHLEGVTDGQVAEDLVAAMRRHPAFADDSELSTRIQQEVRACVWKLKAHHLVSAERQADDSILLRSTVEGRGQADAGI